MDQLPQVIQHKAIDAGGQFIITYMSQEMKQRFEAHPYTVAMDGTHDTNNAKFILVTIMILGKFLCEV